MLLVLILAPRYGETGLVSWPGGLVRFEDKICHMGTSRSKRREQICKAPWCRWAGGRDRDSDPLHWAVHLGAWWPLSLVVPYLPTDSVTSTGFPVSGKQTAPAVASKPCFRSDPVRQTRSCLQQTQ